MHQTWVEKGRIQKTQAMEGKPLQPRIQRTQAMVGKTLQQRIQETQVMEGTLGRGTHAVAAKTPWEYLACAHFEIFSIKVLGKGQNSCSFCLCSLQLMKISKDRFLALLKGTGGDQQGREGPG